MGREPKLISVIYEGERHHVSEFAHITKTKNRPTVFCPYPECNSVVVLHLGDIKAHHAKHKPDSNCPLTNPETALHFNTKVYLHSQLLNTQKLYVNQRCSGWLAPEIGDYEGGHRGCRGERARKFLWLSDWDNVKLETSVESRRPDITFYRNDEPIAAIEVLVTHAVDKQKQIDFEQMGLQWLEIKANEDIYSGYDKWTSEKVLSYEKCVPPIPSRTCEKCLKEPENYTLWLNEKIAEERKERIERWRIDKKNREAHERWLKAELKPRENRWKKPAKVEVAKTLQDEAGRIVKYLVMQETEHSDMILQFENQFVASLPSDTENIWLRIIDLYEKHRSSLSGSYTDVTGWGIP